MARENNDNSWISLSAVPFDGRRSANQYCTVLNIKTKELFVVMPGKEFMRLFRYFSESDLWTQIDIAPPIKWEHRFIRSCEQISPTAAFDCNRDAIFVWTQTYFGGYLCKIYLNRSKDGSISGRTEIVPCGGGLRNTDCARRSIVFEDEFHLIGGGLHVVLDAETNEMIWEEPGFVSEEFGGHGMALAQGKILTFGGRLAPDDRPWEEYTNAVYEYDFYDEEWTELPIKYSMYAGVMDIGCTAVLDGKYILAMGGEGWSDKEGWTDNEIRIYSVSDQTIKRSKIKLPRNVGPCQAISIRDKRKDVLAANGFMRREWKESGIASHLYPPQCIIDLIAAWYYNESVHVFNTARDKKAEHYKIDVFDILR